MNKFILCLGHSLLLFIFSGFPSWYHFPSAFSKGHVYLSCSPKAESRGWDYSYYPLSFRLQGSATIAHQALLLCNSYSLLLSLKLLFTDFQEIQCLQLQHLNWTLSLHSIPHHHDHQWSFQPPWPNCPTQAETSWSLPRTGPSRYQSLKSISQSPASFSSHHELSCLYGICCLCPSWPLVFNPFVLSSGTRKPDYLLGLITYLKIPCWIRLSLFNWLSFTLFPNPGHSLFSPLLFHGCRLLKDAAKWCVLQGL